MAQTRQILGYLSSALDNIGSQAIGGSHASLSDVINTRRPQRASPSQLRAALRQQLSASRQQQPQPQQQPMGQTTQGAGLMEILRQLRALTLRRQQLEQAGAPEEMLAQVDEQIAALQGEIDPSAGAQAAPGGAEGYL